MSVGELAIRIADPAPEVSVASDFIHPLKVWRRDGWNIGSTWRWARCPKCRRVYSHVGEDVNLGRRYASYRVYATEAGIVRQVVKRGQQIGRLASLGNGTHLHFRIRRAPFHPVLSCTGTLPSCRHLQRSLPIYPERFTQPGNWVRAL